MVNILVVNCDYSFVPVKFCDCLSCSLFVNKISNKYLVKEFSSVQYQIGIFVLMNKCMRPFVTVCSVMKLRHENVHQIFKLPRKENSFILSSKFYVFNQPATVNEIILLFD